MVTVILVFLALWLLYFLVFLNPFFGRYLGCSSVPGQGLDFCVVVWFSFFVAVLVGVFRCFLAYCFGLYFCVVRGLALGVVLTWSFQFLLVAILVVSSTFDET